MADLVIDYSLMIRIANSLKTLKSTIEHDVKLAGSNSIVQLQGETASAVESSVFGNTTASDSVEAFFTACSSPFSDAVEKLGQLADTFSSVAHAFFDIDADLASRANVARMETRVSDYHSQKLQYQRYLTLKDQKITYQYWDENGNRATAEIPLWSADTPVPDNPTTPPTSLHDHGPSTTVTTLDAQDRIVSETTTVSTADGLTYSETTTYTYGADDDMNPKSYVSTITHSDGTTETITRNAPQPDGSFTVTDQTPEGTSTTTVTPIAGSQHGTTSVTVSADGKTTTTVVDNDGDGDTKTVVGPDGTDEFSGNADTGEWTLTHHTDPPSSDYDPSFGNPAPTF
jgi:hypothetical protein